MNQLLRVFEALVLVKLQITICISLALINTIFILLYNWDFLRLRIFVTQIYLVDVVCDY